MKYLSLFLSEDSDPKALAIVKLGLGLNLLLSTLTFVLLFIAAPRLSIWRSEEPRQPIGCRQRSTTSHGVSRIGICFRPTIRITGNSGQGRSPIPSGGDRRGPD